MSDIAIGIALVVVTSKLLIQRLPNVRSETLAIVSRIAADYELRLCIGVDSAGGTDADGARDLSLALEHDIDKVAIVVGRLGVIIIKVGSFAHPAVYGVHNGVWFGCAGPTDIKILRVVV